MGSNYSQISFSQDSRKYSPTRSYFLPDDQNSGNRLITPKRRSFTVDKQNLQAPPPPTKRARPHAQRPPNATDDTNQQDNKKLWAFRGRGARLAALERRDGARTQTYSSEPMMDVVEPFSVFVDLGLLVVEGRTAGFTSKGYGEGPHVRGRGHVCGPANFLCVRAEKFRKHMQLLWQNNIPMCIEVFMCADCTCGNQKALSADVGNVRPMDCLLEQWVITVTKKRGVGAEEMSVRSLFQAVRSQLHFSQLSAWWSRTKGTSPLHVAYRLTMPGDAFASQFWRTPEEHTFPLAAISSNSAIQVSVKALPRMDSIPQVTCLLHSGAEKEEKQQPDENGKASGEPFLGECLLDLPQSRDLFPRHYQNQSAESVVFNRRQKGLSGSPPGSPVPRRLSRQDVARRRELHKASSTGLVDDRMQNPCTRSGKHHCSCAYDEELEAPSYDDKSTHKLNLELSRKELEEVLAVLRDRNAPTRSYSQGDTKGPNPCQSVRTHYCTSNGSSTSTGKADLLLDAILRTCERPEKLVKCKHKKSTSDLGVVSSQLGHIASASIKNEHISIGNIETIKGDKQNFLPDTAKDTKSLVVNKCNAKCPSEESFVCTKSSESSEIKCNNEAEVPFKNKSELRTSNKCEFVLCKKESEVQDNAEKCVPTASEKAKFRRSFDSAASMVFHCRTGLPLTSSPAPVRRGTSRFDFDSSLNSVSAIRSALFEISPGSPEDCHSLSSDDAENECSTRSPCCAGSGLSLLGPCSSLLGSFEESVLNGRLEPVSTVQGFTADLGASGSFCPRHVILPVTVFFYTLGDNDKVSTPYLGHINLGKKGYNVPRCGTIQVTLFNPLGTVVKMFVVMYNLNDMPANSHTFLRQRTLYMPANSVGDEAQKWLRYLIHLRFSSSKSGRIYLHTDIRMIIFRKSDMDTATAHGLDMSYELRSFTHGPTNPKFSPKQ